MRFLRKWGHRQLLASWLVYWTVLLAAVLGPTAARWWRLQRTEEHGTVTFTYDGGTLRTLLWVAGPPLLLGILWLATRPRRGIAAPGAPRALPAERVDEEALRPRPEAHEREREERRR